ncbi:MAG TPA: neutral/alkaline non-lysosomal ceramidase N-terminal domain-containing protein [Armatimonadota bacterium]
MRLGIGKAIITPPVGTPLAGFGSRDHGSEGVLDELEVRVLWFQEGESTRDSVCLITADVLGFDFDFAAGIREELGKETGIPAERVLLAASHTHSAQQMMTNIVGTGDPVAEVVASTRQNILDAVKEARANLRGVTLHAGRGELVGYSVNRRVVKDGKVGDMLPNPSGQRDDEVIAISCRDESSGEIAAVLFHFTCHPSTMCTYEATADYPGVARRYVEGALGKNVAAAFLPGCCGDVRTNATIVGGSSFRGGIPQDIKAFGEALGAEVLRIVNDSSEPLHPSLGGKIREITLELAGHPSREEIEACLKSESRMDREWAKRLLSLPFSTKRAFSIQRIDLADEIMLVAMSGEVVSEYGHYIKRLRPDVFAIPLGYSNGVLAYIPTAEIIAQGGYEGETSCKPYGLPSVFKPEIEGLIKDTIRELMA